MQSSVMKNDQTIRVSIIMPTYNRAEFIMETIESIFNQTYTNWELIIADDGSEDETQHLVESLQDPRIIYHRFEHCGKGGRIKNLALKSASGEWLAFIDSDDLWHPAKLEKQIEALYKFPTAGFCVTNGYNFRERGKAMDHFYKQKEGSRLGQLFIPYFQSELSGFIQALVVRKKMLDQIGGFKEEKKFSDVDCIIALAYSFPGLILYEPLVYRRLHNSNYSSFWKEKFDEEGLDLIRENQKKLPVNVYKNALFRLHINRGEKFMVEGLRKKALKNFVKAWKYMPFSIIPLRKVAKAFLKPRGIHQIIP
jgi:glycosyltransferase involved in cell wall biosynthesis